MGRKSRTKRERREHGSGIVGAAAKGRSQAGLLALVEAAAVSPMSNHRVPSLALIFDAVLKRVRPGSALVDPAMLPVLLDAAHQEQPAIANIEDMTPPDAREAAVVRWGDEIYRLLPSSLDHPVAIIEFLDLLAGTIDSVLVPARGYGLFDVVELVLRRVDRVAATLSPVWPAGERPDLDDPATITDAELQAAAGLGTFDGLLNSCSDPARARAALEAHSRAAKRLRCDLASPISSFGDVVAVKRGAGAFLPLPAALLMEALLAAASSLADQAVRLDAEVANSWKQQAGQKLGHLLAGSGHPLEPLTTPAGARIYFVKYEPTQVLLVDLVTTINNTHLGDALGHSNEQLAAAASTFPEDATVAALQVIATTSFGYAIALEPDGALVMELQDVVRIVRGIAPEPADLWRYVIDRQQGDIHLSAPNELDKWETWKSHDKAFPGGPSITDLFCVMDSSDVEWTAESDKSDLERALLSLLLPPTRDWPLVKVSGDEAEIGDIASQQRHDIYLWDVPVAVSVQRHGFSRPDADTIFDLVSGLGFVLKQVREPLQSALRAAAATALRVEFRAAAGPDADPIRAEGFEPPVLVIQCGSSLRDELIRDSAAVQSRLGQILGDTLVAGPDRSAFLDAWEAAPPAVRFDVYTVLPTRQTLPRPAQPEAWNANKWMKRLLRHLQATRVEPGEYAGEAAKRLDSETIHPWLLARLRERFQRYDRAHLLEFALSQLERLSSERWHTDRQVSALKGFPSYSTTKAQQFREEKQRHIVLARVVSLVIEELLGYQSSGQDQIDNAGWVDLISLTELCVESGTRSEIAHRGLQSYTITITDTHELRYEAQDSMRVDLQAFGAAAAAVSEPPPLPMSEPGEGDPDTTQSAPASSEGILGVLPALRPVDDKFRQEHGFGINAVVDLLVIAQQWPLSESREHTTATISQIAQAAEEAVEHLVSTTEYEAAIRWLALDSEQIATELEADADAGPVEHWELESRAERIVVRPFVRWGDEVFILPWTAGGGLRILWNYLSESRLPWPMSMVGPETTKALQKVRQARNTQLERDCRAALAQPHVRVRGNIKHHKAKSVGIDHLSGEIDALAVDERSDRMWVVEVKDPHFPYSTRLMDRQVQDFHKPGGYIDKLRSKVEDVARCASAVAAKLAIEPADREWQTRGVIVTRRVTPAAFAGCEDVLFRTIDDVGDIVNGDNESSLCLS